MKNYKKQLRDIKRVYKSITNEEIPPPILTQLTDLYVEYYDALNSIKEHGQVFVNKYGVMQKNPSITIKQTNRKLIISILKDLSIFPSKEMLNQKEDKQLLNDILGIE